MSDLGKFSSVGPVGFGSLDGARFVSHVTADSLKKTAQLGARVIYKGEEYVYVYNNGGSDASIGRVMILSLLSGYSLTVSSVSGNGIPMGVVKHNSIPAGNYGWLLVRGISPVAMESTLATGILIAMGSDGGVLTYPTSANTDTLKYQLLGTVISSGTGISTTGLGQAYIKCWG